MNAQDVLDTPFSKCAEGRCSIFTIFYCAKNSVRSASKLLSYSHFVPDSFGVIYLYIFHTILILKREHRLFVFKLYSRMSDVCLFTVVFD